MSVFQKINATVTIPFALIITLFIALSINGHNNKKILVLHSYYTDYPWVTDLDNGLNSVFSKQQLVTVKTYYMDTKRNPDELFKKKAARLAKNIIDSEKPDILIAIDDDAQQYVAKHFINSKDMGIIHLGINNTAEAYGYDKANNTTGILERIPIKAFINSVNVILRDKIIDKRKIKVMHIGDSSEIVMLDDKYINNYKDWQNIEITPSKLVKTLNQWKKAILNYTPKIDVLMITNSGKQLLEQENSDKLVDSKELLEWTLKNSKCPIIGMNDFLVSEGLPFAVSVSPYEFGVSGATCALNIISKKVPISEISKRFPTAKSDHFVVTMRPKQIDKLGWNFPEIYTSFANATKRIF